MAKTLLLADGSVTIQRVIELTFAHEDVRVVTVPDGARAIQWLDAEKADIVLVDVDLPEVDGYSVAAHMKKSQKLRHVPVLLLAGAFDPVDQDRVRSIGCDGVIVKPFEPQVVVSRVKELLAVVPTPAKRENRPPQAAPMGPADSPALAVLKSAAEAREGDEPGRRLPKPEPIFTRRAPEPVPATQSAYERGNMPVGQPEPLEPPTRLVWDTGSTVSQPVASTPAPVAPAPASPKVSLASAFSALLAAEQSAQPAAPAAAPAAPSITEASVEETVRRVLVRMTDDLVRRIVVETAERLIKEEIEKIKASPE